ncbi:MAG: GTPase domain-containing protein [Burkholderiaceae bacterium]|nr:GTPase domain-containing protein [Burkholderiaceae bacterium]
MTIVTLSLVSHTNVGKTTLARTLLGSDVGVVRDAPHVTQFADGHDLRLRLWDTPGFGDSARLARRLRQRSQPLGWFLSEVWDRWRDHGFWASQQALRHVQAESDVVLYLVNAAESPQAAGYVAPEMDLLAWVGKPVLVLLNQLGAPRAAAEEAAEVDAWRSHLVHWPLVQAVLPLDAFARCWVHEATLLQAVQVVLQGERAEAMARLTAAWGARRQQTFEAAMQVLAASLARTAAARETVAEDAGLAQRLRQFSGAVARRLDTDGGADPASAAQQRLAAALEAEVRQSTTQLIELHGLEGQAQGEILDRVAGQFARRQRVPEGKAAILGGAVTGALAGLKADIASGGLTLGGGLIAGGLIGALGAAGLARGINVVRGTGRSWVAWSDAAMGPLVEAALLRYLAVAHFGRGRGEWVQGEAPPHWAAAVAEVLAAQRDALAALWASRSDRVENAGEAERLEAALQPLLARTASALLARLYPGSHNPPP